MSDPRIPIPYSILLPRCAYRFWPDASYNFHGTGKHLIRHIFEFQSLTAFENEKLSRLEEEIKDHKIDGYEIPLDWSRNHLLRFCYGTGWKTRIAVKALVSHLKWRHEKMPDGYTKLYPKVEKLLNSGAFYVFGRDSLFRPLIVMNFSKIDFKSNTIEEYIEMLCFLLDYVIDNMLLPGQIENWVVLIDLGKKGLGNLSVNSLKQVLSILQANYRCRLGMNYIVNPPKSIWMLWNCIKPFLDEVTVSKIKISNSSCSNDMLATFNPYQVEEKYGGKAPNALNYWPPTVPDKGFESSGSEILLQTRDSYEFFHKIQDVKIEEIAEKSTSPVSLHRSRVNSLDISIERSEVTLEDLDDDAFGLSDSENHSENLVDFQDALPFNEKTGLKSPEKLKIGMKPLEELNARSGQKKVLDGNLKADKENEPDNLLSPFKVKKSVENELADFETPRKNGPRPIGLIIEKDDRFKQCTRFACCENVTSNCIIW